MASRGPMPGGMRLGDVVGIGRDAVAGDEAEDARAAGAARARSPPGPAAPRLRPAPGRCGAHRRAGFFPAWRPGGNRTRERPVPIWHRTRRREPPCAARSRISSKACPIAFEPEAQALAMIARGRAKPGILLRVEHRLLRIVIGQPRGAAAIAARRRPASGRRPRQSHPAARGSAMTSAPARRPRPARATRGWPRSSSGWRDGAGAPCALSRRSSIQASGTCPACGSARPRHRTRSPA